MEILEKIFSGGVVGAGGAGFPTHKKLVPGVKMLIVNAAECEPLLCSDRLVMRRHAGKVIDALILLRDELNIGEIVIGTKKKYTQEIAALQDAIDQRKANIRIHGVGSFYPAGDEQILICEITGKTVPPGGIPLALDIVVINVTTAMNIDDAVQGIPVTEKYITVSGEVAHPCIVHVPVGTSVADCIAAAGGPLKDVETIVMGGPMMGKQYDISQLDQLYIGKSDGGILLLPSGHPLPKFVQKPLQHVLNVAKSACIQCSYCTEMCPRYLIGHNLRPNRVMRLIATGTNPEDMKDALLCCECGICELYACPMFLSPRQVNIFIKGELRKKGIRDVPQEINASYKEMREYRRIAQDRIISRLDLTSYPTHLEEVRAVDPQRVCIALRHGIGKAASPIVQVGECVKKGQKIATVDFADVGSEVHASVDGCITAVDNWITIEREASI